jgi:hypothetical protein
VEARIAASFRIALNPTSHPSEGGIGSVQAMSRQPIEPRRTQRRLRLEGLKRRIELGRYRPDALRIAQALLRDKRARAALGVTLTLLPPDAKRFS